MSHTQLTREVGRMTPSEQFLHLVNEIEFAINAHAACLSYGKDYLLLPRYDGACEVVSAQGVFAHAPTLIFACPIGISSTERYLNRHELRIQSRTVQGGWTTGRQSRRVQSLVHMEEVALAA